MPMSNDSGGFWSKFLTGLGGSPMMKGSLLGAGLNALGNRVRPNPPGTPPKLSGNTLQYNPDGGPGLLNPTSSIIPSPDAGGGDLPRPTLMAPGNRIQQMEMGPAPTRPGFKFPSMMYTE